MAAYAAVPPSTVPGLLLAAFFFSCVASGKSIGGLLGGVGPAILGECIYVLHGCLLNILFVFVGASLPTHIIPALMPLVGLAIVVIAAVTYQCVELPFMRLGRRLAQPLTKQHLREDSPVLEIAP